MTVLIKLKTCLPKIYHGKFTKNIFDIREDLILFNIFLRIKTDLVGRVKIRIWVAMNNSVSYNLA